MVDFHNTKLDEKLQTELNNLHIDYAFQPIFLKDGKSVYAYEALMRPKDTDITKLIEQYESQGKLHILEVATFIGAVQSYRERGYTEYVTINSFPTETLTDEECAIMDEMFPDLHGKGIIEVLEYPTLSLEDLHHKCDPLTNHAEFKLAIDDFGSGNHMSMECVDYYRPHIVKLAKEVITGIDHDAGKQADVDFLVEEFHHMDILVVAEGIETKEEYEYLSSHGIDLFQGYYLGRPA